MGADTSSILATSRKNIMRDDANFPLDETSLDIVLADLDSERLIQGSMVTGLSRQPTSPFITDLGNELLAWTWAFE